MLVSKTAEHAIRALIYIVSKQSPDYVPVQEISENTDVFPAFLGKIVQRLVDSGILVTKKGPRGGVKLARPADTINLYEVVTALDGTALWERCVLGLDSCVRAQPCPLHLHWSGIREAIKRMLQSFTLADLGRRMQQAPFRLRNEAGASL